MEKGKVFQLLGSLSNEELEAFEQYLLLHSPGRPGSNEPSERVKVFRKIRDIQKEVGNDNRFSQRPVDTANDSQAEAKTYSSGAGFSRKVNSELVSLVEKFLVVRQVESDEGLWYLQLLTTLNTRNQFDLFKRSFTEAEKWIAGRESQSDEWLFELKAKLEEAYIRYLHKGGKPFRENAWNQWSQNKEYLFISYRVLSHLQKVQTTEGKWDHSLSGLADDVLSVVLTHRKEIGDPALQFMAALINGDYNANLFDALMDAFGKVAPGMSPETRMSIFFSFQGKINAEVEGELERSICSGKLISYGLKNGMMESDGVFLQSVLYTAVMNLVRNKDFHTAKNVMDTYRQTIPTRKHPPTEAETNLTMLCDAFLDFESGYASWNLSAIRKAKRLLVLNFERDFYRYLAQRYALQAMYMLCPDEIEFRYLVSECRRILASRKLRDKESRNMDVLHSQFESMKRLFLAGKHPKKLRLLLEEEQAKNSNNLFSDWYQAMVKWRLEAGRLRME